MNFKKWLIGAAAMAVTAVVIPLCGNLPTSSSSVSTVASAETYEDIYHVEVDDLRYYELSNGTIEIYGCQRSYATENNPVKIDIPAEIDGNSVTSISSWAFDGFTRLTSITIPDSVTNIGEEAFKDCTSLTSVKIPDGVKNIGYRTFYNCTSLKTITIPESVTSIGDDAFGYCYDGKVKGVKINYVKNTEGHRYAASNGFTDDAYIITDKLRDGTISISYWVGSATTLSIPSKLDGKTVTEIGKKAFCDCTSLKSVTIPSSVKYIGYRAFHNFKSLKSVTVPASVTSVGDEAFGYYSEYYYSGYDSVDEKVMKISGFKVNYVKYTEGHRYAAANGFTDETYFGIKERDDGTVSISRCVTSAATLDIPSKLNGKTVAYIDDKAFNDCKSLKTITIPASVKGIGDSAFSGCTSLTSVTIPTGVKSISDYTFSNCTSLKSVKIPGSVTNIGIYAFRGCSSLKSIAIPKSVKSIGEGAFKECALTGITIPSSVTSIDEYAFSDCRSLKSITLPTSVKSIGESAFERTGLTSIKIPNGVTVINKSVFKGSDIKSITIPTSVKSIDESTFENSSLTSVKIPASVKSIGKNAFSGCRSLKSVTIPASIKSIENNVFEGCGFTNITIPSSVTSIGNYAFSDCENLKSVKIPNSVKSIGNGVFSDCKSLESVTMSNGVTRIEYHAFYNCIGLTNITMSNSLTYIGHRSFENCSKLTSITLPESLTYIDDFAFNKCRSLDSVTIMYNVTFIGESAFRDCDNLKTVIIPDGVTSIGDHAFGYTFNNSSYYYEDWYKKINFFKICCYKGSAAEQYAKDNGFDHQLLDYHTHNFGEWKTTKAATYTSTGTKMRMCSVCNRTEIATIAKRTLAKVTGAKLTGRAADALRINWSKNAYADGYIVEMYQNGKWVRVAKITKNNTTTFRKAGLKAGTAYKFRVRAYKISGKTAVYGAYSATVAARTNPSVVKGAKLTGRAADALRINWTKNTTADGYIVEMYKGGKWVRAAKITKNSTTTYRASGLKASTVYKFRVRAYKMSGKTALYGNYSATVTARTNPSAVKGVKIAGKAKDALRVNWTKNSSAQGYIVEMYKGGKWVKVAKITKNSTNTYRKAGLAKNTTYKFRVKAYYMSGKTALYGNYGSVSGKTAVK